MISVCISKASVSECGHAGRSQEARTLDEVRERLLDVGSVLGGGLDEEHILSSRHLLSLFDAHTPLRYSEETER